MKTYQIVVTLYEGGPVSLGYFKSREDAETLLEEYREEWQGPNVESLDIVEHTLR